MNNYGCYARGATAIAVSSSEMDVAIGFGKNTKRNPKNAAQSCSKMIKKNLEKSKYSNKFIINLISASELPEMQSIGRKKIIDSGLTPKALMKLYTFSQKVLQKGAGRDDEIVKEMINNFPNYHMIGGGTIDNGAGIISYQFFNKDVLNNAVVSLAINTNNSLDVLTTHNMKKTGIEFEISKTNKDGRIIQEINGKPAFSELLNLLNWSRDLINEDNWLQTSFYFPIGSYYSNSKTSFGPRVIGFVLGESLVTGFGSNDINASILTIDGRGLLETIDKNLGSYSKPPSFGIIASCTTRLETMGDKLYYARDRILKYFNDKPFIVFYVGGESTYSPEKGFTYINMSFNSALFWDEN
jgi:hypothetical protein